ncbi:MAG: recombinase family protein [SAR324 cluster bacterium]|nr:recombinase family protein [SAR324 cluster bacterium]MCZ6842420.1 recombinase family protein [SAR324 cluster bacterium]
MKAVGYTCLNTMSQQPKNFTLAVQEKVVRNYIKSQGWEQGKIYREVISSGDSQGQPTLDQIIADSGSGKFELLVVARLDRLTRNIRKLNTLISTVCMQNGVGLISIEEGLNTHSDSGELVLKIIDIVTKWDNKRISDRTREIIARKRARGERVGHAPFGYTYQNKKLVEVKKELETTNLIRKQREVGMSYHRIARFLNDQSIGSKRGGIWYAETVKTVFQNSLRGVPMG